MDLISEAKRIIDIFDDKNKSMDFTMYLENIKSGIWIYISYNKWA